MTHSFKMWKEKTLSFANYSESRYEKEIGL